MNVDHKPEIAPFNKNPPKAGGVFCFVGVGCSAPSPLHRGTLTPTMRTKYHPCFVGLFLQGLKIKEIAIAISSY